MVGIMRIKAKGLNIEYQNGHIGFLLTQDAVKEFCDYQKIPYDDKDIHTSGAVTTTKLYIQIQIGYTFSRIITNNLRKRHGIPMLKRKYLQT